MNNNQLFPKCTTENRPLKKKTSFYYLLVYVPPWPLHKQCPAFPLASPAARFATRASAAGACGSGLNSLPSPTGQRSRNDSPSKFHLCSYNLWAFLPLSCTDHSIASLSLYLFSPLPIGIVGRNFMFLAISFNNSRNDNTISNIQYPIYNIQCAISSRQVMRSKKNRNEGNLSWSNNKFSKPTSPELYGWQ